MNDYFRGYVRDRLEDHYQTARWEAGTRTEPFAYNVRTLDKNQPPVAGFRYVTDAEKFIRDQHKILPGRTLVIEPVL